MFQSSKIAKDLIWHAEGGEFDGKMHHPSDSPSWKVIDHRWPNFAAEPRNLRLAISEDGINPHSSLSSRSFLHMETYLVAQSKDILSVQYVDRKPIHIG